MQINHKEIIWKSSRESEGALRLDLHSCWCVSIWLLSFHFCIWIVGVFLDMSFPLLTFYIGLSCASAICWLQITLHSSILRSSHGSCSYKKGVFKKFAKFTGHIYARLSFSKRDSGTVVSCEFCEIFKNLIWWNICKRQHSSISWAAIIFPAMLIHFYFPC